MKPIGSDGQEIPTPPETIKSWPERARLYLAQSLGIAATILGGIVISAAPRLRPLIAAGWPEFARHFVLILAISAGVGFAGVALCWFVVAPFWPWTRKSVGKKLERQIAAIGLDQLSDEIEYARAALKGAASEHLRTAWQEWLGWLESHRDARLVIGAMEPERTFSIESWTIRPALGPQIAMACIGLPFIVVAGWSAFDQIKERDFTWMGVASSVGVGALGLFCLCVVSTVQIRLTPQKLTMRSFWRTQWSIDRSRAELCDGLVGDGASLPGFRVFDKSNGKKVGEILLSQFRSADIEKLASMFPCEPISSSESQF